MKLVCTTAALATVLFVTGCRTTSLGPVPDRAEFTISVEIDSIPSGADVYAIEGDGQLGRRIGTTPFVHTCGLAARHQIWDDTKENINNCYYRAYSWGTGTFWRQANERKILTLDIALAKGDHSLGVARKTLWVYGDSMKDECIALTVPLKTLAQVNREMEMYVRQQALNRNQNINVYQQKDGLDSVNSGLDALIKLQGLGAFSNR